MKTGDKMLKAAVIYDVMNRTCCMVDWNDPGGRAFALYFHPHRWAFDSLSAPTPGICHPYGKKGKFLGVSPGLGGGEGREQGTVGID